MSRINVKEVFGYEIQSLFDDRPMDDSGIISRGFAVEETIANNSILFIGMNPSFDEAKEVKNGSLGIVSYYNDFGHKYFSPMIQIAGSCGVSFSHHDLYFVKETSQNKVKELSVKHKIYFKRQIEITNEIIRKVQPIAIVIANASVSDLFIDRQLNCAHFNNEIGTYLLNAPGLSTIPVFCSSMLSETRALDKYSRERLIWHIQRTLKLPILNTMLNEKIDWEKIIF